jgi:hypothetical protein
MKTDYKSVHDVMSTSGLSILAQIIARYHLNQLRAENPVHSVVPRGQDGGQVDGHIKEEGFHEPAPTDPDPAI